MSDVSVIPNLDTCFDCGKPIGDAAWHILRDFCDEHYVDWVRRMDAESRAWHIESEWAEYIDVVENAFTEGEDSEQQEWDWADWLAESETQTLRDALRLCAQSHKELEARVTCTTPKP